MGYDKIDENTLMESDSGMVDGVCQVCGKAQKIDGDGCECVWEKCDDEAQQKTKALPKGKED